VESMNPSTSGIRPSASLRYQPERWFTLRWQTRSPVLRPLASG
jgi:hypothetical protein